MNTGLKTYTRQQVADYRELTERDECSVTMRSLSPAFRAWERNHKIVGRAVHHIAGRTSREMQSFCNLIMVDTAWHEWNHQRGGESFNVGNACEAVCLWSKWNRHQQQSLYSPEYRLAEPHRQHWNLAELDAVRSKCVRDKTIAGRVEYLADSLRGSAFSEIADKLRELCDPK